MTLFASLQGPEHQTLVSQIARLSNFDTEPTSLHVDELKPKSFDAWRALLPMTKSTASAFWETPTFEMLQQISYIRSSELVNVKLSESKETLDDTICLVETWPFELAVFRSPFQKQWLANSVHRWGFGRSISDHGWGCAFRGAGHDRLVSRRWLDFGPWRVIRRANDTTFIQFHDLAITDPAEAYAQAAPGHDRMGISPSGGYIAWYLNGLLEGARKVNSIYYPETKLRKIIIAPGNEVTQGQMICQCAERLHHRLTQPAVDRIENVAYIFADKGDAEAHLHELWLRELQCWYLDERGEHRLDADYHPVPNPPAWVRALDGR